MKTTPERSIEEIKKDYVKKWDKGEFEWNHHEGDKLGRKPISPERIWQTFIEPALQAERQKREEVVEELRRDKERLDFLDSCNLTLNDHYQTNYGWKLILNHNVTRLMSERGLDFIDLHDSEGGNEKFKSCRDAIDVAITQPNNQK